MKKALLISCFDWYEKRLKAIRSILEESYEVSVLTSDFDHVRKEKVNIRREDCIYLNVPPYEKNLSAARMRSHLQFGKKANQYLSEMKPDLVYLLLPPNNTARYCATYKKKHPESFFLVDLIDLWPESMPLGKLKKTFPAHRWADMRNRNLACADHIFTECALYQHLLKEYIPGEKSTVLHLYKRMEHKEKVFLEEQLSMMTNDPQELRLCYLGSINHIVDIDRICRIVRNLRTKMPVRIDVIGEGESGQRFINDLQNTGASVFDHGAVYDETEKIRILAGTDFAFNVMIDSVRVGLTIKSIDYLSYGIPLINNIKGDTWKLIEKYGIGVNVTDDLKDTAERIIKYKRNAGSKTPVQVCGIYEKLFTYDAFCRKFQDAWTKVEEAAKY